MFSFFFFTFFLLFLFLTCKYKGGTFFCFSRKYKWTWRIWKRGKAPAHHKTTWENWFTTNEWNWYTKRWNDKQDKILKYKQEIPHSLTLLRSQAPVQRNNGTQHQREPISLSHSLALSRTLRKRNHIKHLWHILCDIYFVRNLFSTSDKVKEKNARANWIWHIVNWEKLPKIQRTTRKMKCRSGKKAKTMWKSNNKIAENGICFSIFFCLLYSYSHFEGKIWCVHGAFTENAVSIERTLNIKRILSIGKIVLSPILSVVLFMIALSPRKTVLIFRCWRMWFIGNFILKHPV